MDSFVPDLGKISTPSLLYLSHNFSGMTKETASLRAYEIEKRRQQLRRAGFMLYETDKFTEVVQNIEEAVESYHISLREDKQLWADIGK